MADEINNTTEKTSRLDPLVLALESLEQSKDMVFRFGTSGKISYANKAASDQLGYTNEELLSMSIADLDTGLTEEVLVQMWVEIRRLHSDSLERTYKRKDGTLFPVEASAHYVKFEDKEYVNVFVKNIEERKTSEAHLEKAHKDLEESEERYRNIAENASDGIYQVDLTGKIIYANKANAEIFGYTVEELKTKNFADLVTKESLPQAEEDFKKSLTGENTSGTMQAIRKDGSVITISYSGTSLVEKGKITGTTGMIRDVTVQREKDKALELAQKELKQTNAELEEKQKAVLNVLEDIQEEKESTEKIARDLEKFELAVENATDHIIITDPDAKIVYVNRAAEELTGFSKEEILGQNPRLWGKQMSSEYYKKLWKTIKIDKKPFIGEIINKNKKGGRYEAAVRISPVLNKKGDVIFFVSLERDITAQKKAERSKTEFVSLASHQLQTPLTSVRWNAELILDSNEKNHNLSPKQLEYIKDLYNSTIRTIELVNSLLNVSRIELGTINVDPEPTDIKSISISCSDEIQKEALNKNIKIETFYDPDLPLINVDPIFFRMILSNLLSNAVKYTNPGGSVKLETIKEEKSVIIKVSDTGVGIPKKQQSKIYTKFFRADNAQILSEGSGLGLYIVKSVLEKTGGKLWFESEEDKGTTFFIELPLSGMKKLKGTKGFSFT